MGESCGSTVRDIEKVESIFKDGVGYDSEKLIQSVQGLAVLRAPQYGAGAVGYAVKSLFVLRKGHWLNPALHCNLLIDSSSEILFGAGGGLWKCLL